MCCGWRRQRPHIDSKSLRVLSELFGSDEHSHNGLPTDSASQGMQVLSEGKDPNIDVVLIHGLNGHRERSWTDHGGVRLSSLLSNHLQRARVLTYGYDARTHSDRSLSELSIRQHAERLLTCLRLHRGADPCRPIIFLAHCLGGILVKQMLIEAFRAHGGQPNKHLILQSTSGILFFGTPHEGLSRECQKLAARLFKAKRGHLYFNQKLLDILLPNSDYLRNLTNSFSGISQHIAVVNFYEEYPTRLPSFPISKPVMLVSSWSGTLARRREWHVSMSKDHHNLIKFGSIDDPDFRLVFGEISEIALAPIAESSHEKRADSDRLIAAFHNAGRNASTSSTSPNGRRTRRPPTVCDIDTPRACIRRRYNSTTHAVCSAVPVLRNVGEQDTATASVYLSTGAA